MAGKLSPRQWALEWVRRIWNAHDLTGVPELMHPECTFTEMAGSSWESKGHQAYLRNFELFHTAVPDMRVDFWRLIADDRAFVWAAALHGTLQAESLGSHVRGQKLRMNTLVWGQVDDGKVTRAYNFVSFNQPAIVLPGWTPAPMPVFTAMDDYEPGAGNGEPLKVVKSYLESAWGSRQAASLEQLVSRDVVIREVAADGHETRGLADVVRNAEWLKTQIPEPQITILETVQEVDAAAVVFELSGRIAGTAFGPTARGSLARIRGGILGSVEGGLLKYAYFFLDLSRLGQELPAP